MTPTELEHRCRYAYNRSTIKGELEWDGLDDSVRGLFSDFANELLRDLETYRQKLIQVHQFAKPIIEWTEPVFQQELRRRELEPPPPVQVGELQYQFDPKKWEELTGRSWDNWLKQEAEREVEQKR